MGILWFALLLPEAGVLLMDRSVERVHVCGESHGVYNMNRSFSILHTLSTGPVFIQLNPSPVAEDDSTAARGSGGCHVQCRELGRRKMQNLESTVLRRATSLCSFRRIDKSAAILDAKGNASGGCRRSLKYAERHDQRDNDDIFCRIT